MYGGSGVTPASSSRSNTARSPSLRTSQRPSPHGDDARQRPGVAQRLAGEHLAGARTAAQQHLPQLSRGTPVPGSSAPAIAALARRRAQEQHLDAPAGRPAEEGARREDARVVAHQHVAGAQQARQIGEDAVLQSPAARRQTSSRDASRGSAGCWAIELRGSS